MRLDFFKLFGLGASILLLAASFPAFAGATYQYIQGGTGSTTAPAGQVLYGGASSYQSTATTTASCSGSASCSSFTVIGSSPVTITATGGGSSDPFTHPSYGSATTTTLGLLGGLLDTASTTFTSSPQFNSLFAMSVNPDGTTADTFNFGGRPNVTIPVPYVRPTQSNQNIAFDIFPNGTPGNGFGNNIYGVAWEDICSTDIFAGPDYECLHLGKALNGASNVSSSQGGNGLIQPLAFQLFGGNTGVGTSSPYAYFAIQASTTAGKPNEPLFAIASSSTDLIVTNGGLVGIGTGTPDKILTVEGNQSGGIARFQRDFTTSGSGQVVGTTAYTLNERDTQLENQTGPGVTYGVELNGGTENLYASEEGVRDNADTSGAWGLSTYNAGTAATAIFANHLQQIGLGTTSPNWNLDVVGTRPSIDISDNSAGTNLKHWLFTSEGGNLYIGTTTDLYATSSPPAITFLNKGNIGIGTSSPPVLGLTVGQGTIFNPELKLATTTTMYIGVASSTQQLVQYGTSAMTLNISAYELIPGEKTTIVTCNPTSTGGAITFSNLHYSGGAQPGNTTAANQCDEWFISVTSGTTTPIAVLTGMTPGVQ